jgi:hypothetical protein
MSKFEVFEYCQSVYPAMRWHTYKGKDGGRVLWAIYYKTVDISDT